MFRVLLFCFIFGLSGISEGHIFSCLKSVLKLTKSGDYAKFHPSQIELRGVISSLLPLYQEAMIERKFHWAGNWCRGGSSILQNLLRRNGVETIAVNNQSHTFLMIQNFMDTGEDLIIDPTIQQYFKGEEVPIVFIGFKDEFYDFVMDSKNEINRNDPEKFFQRYLDVWQYDVELIDFLEVMPPR